MALTISDELQSLIPPLSPEERAQLAANILQDGCRDVLIVWQEEQILLDGHHRYAICTEHDRPYTIQELSLPDMDAARLWMIQNQLGRRNLTPNQMAYYRGEQYNLQKGRHGGDRKSDGSSPQNEYLKTADRLATEHGVSRATIERNGTYAEALDTIATVLGPDVRSAIRDGHLPLTKQDVPVLAARVEASPEMATQVAEALQGDHAAAAVHAILTEVLDPDPPETVPTTLEQTSTGDFEWYTPREVLDLVRAVLTTIDIDPASCVAAQANVQARIYYTLEDDGLRHPWPGVVFCNPPYKMPQIARFIGKLCEELDAQRTTAAILLVNAATETDWFQRAFARADAVCFPDGRIQFVHTIRNGDHPCQGQALLYFGSHPERFCAVFAALGVSTRVRCALAALPQLTLADAPAPVPEAPDCPPFDTTIYKLGKLCPQGHAWGQTGQSRLRIKGSYCPECNRALKRQTRQPQAVAMDAP
jgi:phage N-6-adenine-methyltransferase